MKESFSHETLRKKYRGIRDTFPEPLRLRVHRAISWYGRSENCEDDPDAKFLFLWIAFNATYVDGKRLRKSYGSEEYLQQSFFTKLANLDQSKRINDAIWYHFSGSIKSLMNNRYVFKPFWDYHNGSPKNINWEEKFKASRQMFLSEFKKGNTAKILNLMFSRLYVLRNQMIHGGSTWGGGANRSQVRDGAAILSFLVPVFIDILLNNPEIDWGEVFYPKVEE